MPEDWPGTPVIDDKSKEKKDQWPGSPVTKPAPVRTAPAPQPAPSIPVMRAYTKEDVTGIKTTRDKIEQFKRDWLNTTDETKNQPRRTLAALIRNRKDPVEMARLGRMNPITQMAILEKAEELRVGSYDPTDPTGYAKALGAREEQGTFTESAVGALRGLVAQAADPRMLAAGAAVGPVLGAGTRMAQGAIAAKYGMAGRAAVKAVPKAVAVAAGAAGAGLMAPAIKEDIEQRKVGAGLVHGAAAALSLGAGALAARGPKPRGAAGKPVPSAEPASPSPAPQFPQTVVHNGQTYEFKGIGANGKPNYSVVKPTAATAPTTPEFSIKEKETESAPVQTSRIGQSAEEIIQPGATGQALDVGGVGKGAGGKGQEATGKGQGQAQEAAEVGGTPEIVTSPKNAAQAEDRVKANLAEMSQDAPKSWDTELQEAKSKGYVRDAHKIAQTYNAKPGVMSAAEQMGLATRQEEIKLNRADLAKQIQATNDPAELARHDATMDSLLSEFEEISDALHRSGGTDVARSLNIRKAWIGEGFDITTVEAAAKAKKGSSLTPAETAEIRARVAAHEQAIKDLESHVETQGQKIAELEAQKAVQQAVAQTKKGKTTGGKVDHAARKAGLKDQFNDLKDQWNALGKEDPETGEQSMLSGFSDEHFVIAGKIFRNLVEQGVENLHEIVDIMHDAFDKQLDRTQIHNLIAGYGKPSSPVDPARASLNAKLQNLRSLSRRISKFEDAQAGTQPLKGKAPRPPSEEVKQLQEDLNSYMKSRGMDQRAKPRRKPILGRTPEQRIDAALTRTSNEIERLRAKLQIGDTSKPGTPLPDDPRLNALKAQKKALQDQLNALKPPPEKRTLTTEQRQTMKEKRLARQIDEIDRQIRESDFGKKQTTPIPSTPRIDALQKQYDALKAQRDALAPPAERRALTDDQLRKMAKGRMNREIADIERQLKAGVPDPKKARRTVPLDEEGLRLQNDVILKREQLKDLKRKFEKPDANRIVVNIARDIMLSGYTIFQKLFGASAWNVPAEGLADVFGYAAGKVARSGGKPLGQIASREGAVPMKGVVHGFRKAFTPEAGGVYPETGAPRRGLFKLPAVESLRQVLKTGDSPWAKIAGLTHRGNEFGGIVGRLHGAEKTLFIETPEYYRSVKVRMERLAEQGADLSDPEVIAQANLGAAIDAQNAILRGDNAGSKAINDMFGSVQRSKSLGIRIAGTAAEISVPVRKVAANFLGKMLEGTGLGVPEGALRHFMDTMKAKGGKTEITPEQANKILRAYKYGGFGLVAAYLGTQQPSFFQTTGFYAPNGDYGIAPNGEKRGPMQIWINGHLVPPILSHNPLIYSVQLWATGARASQVQTKEGKAGAGGAAGAVVRGIGEQTPGFSSLEQIGRAAMEPGTGGEKLGRAAGAYARSATVPQLVQGVAKLTDQDAQGNVIQRQPRGFREEYKVGIPGLRKQVPVKPPKGGTGGGVKYNTNMDKTGAEKRLDALERKYEKLGSGK